MPRSPIGKLRVVFLLALAVSCSDRQPRGVIVISLDTLRADHLGAYGYERDTSPNLERLAREGVVFERAIAHASSTTPSHHSLLQARIPSRTRSDHLVLPEYLRDHGFRTAAFTGGGYVAAEFGFARGFEVYQEDRDLASSLPKAVEWLRGHAHERFLLFLHTYDIHLPYDPPEPYDTLFYPSYEGRVTGDVSRGTLRRIRGLDGVAPGSEDSALTSEDRQKIVALYDGGIRYVDEALGTLFDALDELDLWRSTILVVLSDHGEEFWDHGSVIHSHTLYQELIHVPLIFRLPSERYAGTRVEVTLPLIDVAPTIVALLGMRNPPEFEGVSAVPLMAREEHPDRRVISETVGMISVIEPPWKLIRSASRKVELYHLTDDPREQTNLAPRRPEVVGILQSRLAMSIDSSSAVPVNQTEVPDGELRDRLRELGYVQ